MITTERKWSREPRMWRIGDRFVWSRSTYVATGEQGIAHLEDRDYAFHADKVQLKNGTGRFVFLVSDPA